MPVFHARRDNDHLTRKQLHRLLSIFLIPAFTGSANQHLAAALVRVMDMPVVAATGFKGDIGHEYGRFAVWDKGVQVGISDEVLGVHFR